MKSTITIEIETKGKSDLPVQNLTAQLETVVKAFNLYFQKRSCFAKIITQEQER